MGRRSSLLAAAVAVGLMAVAGMTGVAAADPPGRADHGHMLVLGIESSPGSFPPVPIAARGCIDLANNRTLPGQAHEDHRHSDFDGGVFRERTGNIVIPTWPYTVLGQTVPWRDCDDFMAMFGLD